MKKIISLAIIMMAIIISSSSPAQAMDWGYPITEVELRPLDTTPIEYPIYVDVVNDWGMRVPQHDSVTPNGWVVSNRDIASYGQMADAWMQNMGLYELYELVLVDSVQVDLPYIWPATPDEVGRREYTAIVVTLKPISEITETTAQPTTANTAPIEDAPEPTTPPIQAPVQLPATGESDGAAVMLGSVTLILIGLLSRRRM